MTTIYNVAIEISKDGGYDWDTIPGPSFLDEETANVFCNKLDLIVNGKNCELTDTEKEAVSYLCKSQEDIDMMIHNNPGNREFDACCLVHEHVLMADLS